MALHDELARLRTTITEISPPDAMAAMRDGALLLDVRESDEVADGSPIGAHRLGRGFLEFRIGDIAPDQTTPILVLCASGGRSLFVAESLVRMGYASVSSVSGGYRAWREHDLPVEVPRVLTAGERERYARHLLIPEVGDAGQARLLQSRVALVGAGGLGSPIAYYLAAAGVGMIGLIDDDKVERSNLQRQILHTEARVGVSKAQSAAETLAAFNPAVDVQLHELRLDADNAEDILGGYDLVIDGSDNLPTRYVVNDACVRLGIPEIYGAIFRFEGQLSAFWPGGEQAGPCYRCLFPEPPPAELTPSCAEAGVLGVLPGVIGTLMATEALKVLLGVGDPMFGRLVTYDGLGAQFDELRFAADPDCVACGANRHEGGIVQYAEVCSTR